MRIGPSPFSYRDHAWVHALLLLVVGVAAVAESSEPFAETCVNVHIAEVCMEPEEVVKSIDPAALRRMFITKARALQMSALTGKHAVEHPQGPALADKWNEVAAGVLKITGERGDFYRSVFDDLELQTLVKVRFEIRPPLRISGLPNSPRILWSAPGLGDLLRFSGSAGVSQADPEKLAALMNLLFEAEETRSQFGKTFNMIPFLAEFMYQMRIIYRDMDKQVVVFEDQPDGSSPSVDPAGTLYVPRSFFERFDPIEQELALVHEATHLKLPAGTLLLQLVMNRLREMGSMAQVMATSDFRQRMRRINMDMELDIDAGVLTYLRSRPDLRRRYQALIQRLEPGSQRAEIIGFLNRHLETGEWPRPPIRLGLSELAPVIETRMRYESLPDGPEKLDARIREFELTLNVLTQREQAFYKPLYQLMLKHYLQKPGDLITGAGLRYRPSDLELLEEGVSEIFKEVLERWERQ